MSRFKSSALLAALAVVGIGAAFAAPPVPKGHMIATAPGQNKLMCFDGTTDYGAPWGGTCVQNSKGAKGSATLTVATQGYDYAGVYTNDSTMYGQKLADVAMLSFTYAGSDPGAGAPRFSVPIDTDGDGAINEWAYISAFYCNNGEGLVDAIRDQTCGIYLQSGTYYANWAEMVAALPDAKIATDQYVFVIADEVGIWTVNQVRFGKPGK
jgi:hypothetical protein